MLRVDRLHLDRMFCFCACDAQVVEWGREAMPYVDADGARLYVEDSGHGNPIIFVLNLLPTSADGKPSFAISRAGTVALPLTPGATRQAMFPKMPTCMVGNARPTTSPP